MAGVVAERAGLGFEETELRLGLPGGGDTEKDRVKPAADIVVVTADPGKPYRAQVVGWPPVRSFRKNVMSVQSTKTGTKEAVSGTGSGGEKSSFPPTVGAAFVKVSMDGAPYLRKVDLKMYKSYQELSTALEKMFSSFTIGNSEDKDGDWMLVGDVPWK